MFVWRSFRSRRRTAAPHDELHAEMLAGLGTRRRWAGYGLCVFQTRPIKVGNTHVDFTQKAFERAPRARYARVAGPGHPARCASSGMYGEVLTASPAGSAPARCRFCGTYGGQGKAAGSSDLPAALLCAQTGPPGEPSKFRPPTQPNPRMWTHFGPQRRLTIGQAGGR